MHALSQLKENMKIAIIGCGNMGSALAQNLSKTHSLYLYDHHIEKALKLHQEGFGLAAQNIDNVIENVELIILAVKPQNITELSDLIGKRLKKEQILVSILAGISIQTLKELFSNSYIVRMMPNLALLYGEGVIGLSADEDISKEIKENLTNVFELLGKIYWLPENKIDALTALAGSGPAFFFVIIESMIDAGIAMGLTVSEAQSLTFQMLKGSITLLEKTSKHPGELKWQITSPKGTTIAGLKTLEETNLRGSIINTFLAAYNRANQLSSL